MTPSPLLLIESLASQHDRHGFHSGVVALDRYLIQQAGQDVKRHIAAPFVLIDPATRKIAGYYTLSAFAIAPHNLHPDMAKRLPRYPLVPATLLGRLAVDVLFQGRGYGEILLLDALHRTFMHSANVATIGVVVEAHDERAATFYQHFEFKPFPDHPQQLFLSLSLIAQLFSRNAH